MKIPRSFKLFATKINIVWNNSLMNEKEQYGSSRYSESEIILSTTHGINKLSDDKIIDTYYHEKTHMILNTMSRNDLSSDEQFVDVFAKLLRQSDETSEY